MRAHVIPMDDGYLVNFVPSEMGDYLMNLAINGKSLTEDPILLESLVISDHRKVTATGPGLVGGIVGQACPFEIDTRSAGQANLGVTVEGPCETAISCIDNGDGTATCAYYPTQAGFYVLYITFDGYHISGSPFYATVTPEIELDEVRVDGDGIQAHGRYYS